jgi:hypothetical protein
VSGVAEDADGEVAEAGHGSGCVAGADLGCVLEVGDVADVVEGFNVPVAADVAGELVGAGLGGGEAGDGVDGDGAPSAGPLVTDFAGQPDGLGGVGEAEPVAGDDLQAADLVAAVSTVVGFGLYRDLRPGQCFELPVQGRLIPLDDMDVRRPPVGDQPVRVFAVGVQRVL